MRNLRPNGFFTQWVVDFRRGHFAKSVHKARVGFSSTRKMEVGNWEMG